jgi:hypothetical protein
MASADHSASAPDRAVVSSLWIGDRLSSLERLTIHSFLANGHPFHLYAYDSLEGVPEGTVVHSAAEILPKSRLAPFGEGREAMFADLFRYLLLLQRGGWWVDMDVVCLRPLEFDRDHVFGLEDEHNICSAVLRAPAGSALAGALFREAGNADAGAVWGTTGPVLLTRLVKEFDMTDCVEPVVSFYPVHFGQWRRLLEPDGQVPAEAYAVHFWHQQIRTHGIDMDAAFPESSVFEQLRARYL